MGSPSVSITCQQAREYDRLAIERGIPGPVLMENAGRGTLELLLALGASGPLAIVCGKGNNGGDGFVIARWALEKGLGVSVFLVAPPEELRGDAAIAFKPLPALGVPIANADAELLGRLRSSQWVIDAVLGTGVQGEIRPEFARVIDVMNQSNRPILAVDLPSGLDGDTGLPLGPTVRAKHTATFVARKKGFDNPASVAFTGQVHVIPIGAGPPLASLGLSPKMTAC
jgi:NAD(P)H-hydrate epimerase